MSNMSGNGWESHNERSKPMTTDEFELNQEGKPTKAIIGLAILVALGIGLAFFKPTTDNVAKAPTAQERGTDNVAKAPTAQERGTDMVQMNRAPGQTTGQVPTSSN